MNDELIQPENKVSRPWKAVFAALVIGLIFFVWSGSAADPRHALPWGWTDSGWVIPARGLSFLMAGACILYAVLSRVAYRLFTDLPEPRAKPTWAPAICVLILAIAARVAIIFCWTPLPFDPVSMGARHLAWMAESRLLVSSVDLLVVAILLLAVRRAGRSAVWVLLYALHPLTLIEGAGRGSWVILGVLILAMLGASASFVPERLRKFILAGAAAAAVAVVAAAATHGPLNSLPSLLLFGSGFRDSLILGASEALLQGGIFLLAWRRGWMFERTLTHVVVVCVLGMMVVMPVMALGSVVLIPLAWNRAGWVMSLAVLVGYAAVPVWGVTHRWEVPALLVMLAWVPVAIIELQELVGEAAGGWRGRAAETARPPAAAQA